jgi:hypothetical protein
MNISKSAALRQANKAVSMPYKSRNGYSIFVPSTVSSQNSIFAESRITRVLHTSCYQDAIDQRAAYVASIAFKLMGLDDNEYAVIEICMTEGSARAKLEAAIKQD